MMQAARRGLDATDAGKKTKLIAVTQLTSISQEILENELLIKENLILGYDKAILFTYSTI